MTKPYDRAEVLMVASRLYPTFAEQAGYGMQSAAEASVTAAKFLIDEVNRRQAQVSLDPMPAEVGACIELVRAYYRKPGNKCGGPLHLVLDDNNVEDEHVAFCRAEAERIGDADGVAICDKMARWPARWRRAVAECERRCT